MNAVWNYFWELLTQTVQAVGISLSHNWKVLLLSILMAVGLQTYVNSDKLAKVLFKRKKVSIIASVLFGAFTPLCACGTTAVLIGMLTTALPWGPIMAFLTSSPLMSPDGFVFISGVINLRFAIALTVASLVIGIGSGFITNVIEKKTNFLTNQSRYLGKEKNLSELLSNSAVQASCACGAEGRDENDLVNNSEISVITEGDLLCCSTTTSQSILPMNWIKKLKLKEFSLGIFQLGIKKILFFYIIFIAIGFIINYFIPTSVITLLFGKRSFYAVPLASLIGLPLYITTNSGIPIIQSLMESGASEGAMLAFMITGSATSAWVIAGLVTFMKKRAIILYVTFVLAGGILAGYVLDFFNLLL
jgi:uncharacterized membrane protein YraQ (UPF0718 family)